MIQAQQYFTDQSHNGVALTAIATRHPTCTFRRATRSHPQWLLHPIIISIIAPFFPNRAISEVVMTMIMQCLDAASPGRPSSFDGVPLGFTCTPSHDYEYVSHARMSMAPGRHSDVVLSN